MDLVKWGGKGWVIKFGFMKEPRGNEISIFIVLNIFPLMLSLLGESVAICAFFVLGKYRQNYPNGLFLT